MLALVGLGLFDEKDITLRGLEEARDADKVYIELYTGKWHGGIKKLEEMVGKEIIELRRKDLEDNSQEIIKQAKNQKIVVFVLGDPMVATTHSSLILDAKRQNIETKIIHNASIVSAIAETGLHIYKFGPTVTIPFPEKTKGSLPQSVYNTIKDNKERELHTLCLLDVTGEEGRFLSTSEAIKILLDLEKRNKNQILIKESKVAILTDVGNNSKLFYGKIKDFINKDFSLPAVIVVIGKLHFTEEEYLKVNGAYFSLPELDTQ